MNIEKIKNIARSVNGKKLENMDWSGVELISIHIPKSAGTSFYKTLISQYKDSGITRIDMNKKDRININKIHHDKAYISKSTKVIHGHFTIPQLYGALDISKDLPIITWLRDPVERVISNYYYLSKILAQELNENSKDLNLLNRLQKSLVEYAHVESCRNRMTKFLDGIELEELAFIGFVENYSEDLKSLSNMMNWKYYEEVKVNTTGAKNKREVSQEIREEIARLNQEDIALYQKALSLSQQKSKS